MKNHLSFTRVLLLAIGLLGMGLFGAGTRSSFAADEKLTNQSIIDLEGLSLGDAVILEKIKTSKCDFDTSIPALKQLKDAKVSPAVIQAMIATKSAPAPATPAAPAAAAAVGDPNDPASLHAAGVWVLSETNGVKKMTQIESETPAAHQTDAGGAWAMGWGASVKSKVVLTGSKSALRLTNRKPVFYLYIGVHQATGVPGEAVSEFMGAQNPKDILLARLSMETSKGHDQRVLVTGSHNAYAGSSYGVEQKAVRMFDSEKIADGIYKVTPKDDLTDGEYAFFTAVSQGNGRFMAFGIQGE